MQLVVEAISEDMAVKQKTFRLLDKFCPARAVLASNTSGLSITALAEVTGRAGRVAGMHFWNPPHIVPLVEVIQGRQTSVATARSCGVRVLLPPVRVTSTPPARR